jgi:hypothetical protein
VDTTPFIDIEKKLTKPLSISKNKKVKAESKNTSSHNNNNNKRKKRRNTNGNVNGSLNVNVKSNDNAKKDIICKSSTVYINDTVQSAESKSNKGEASKNSTPSASVSASALTTITTTRSDSGQKKTKKRLIKEARVLHTDEFHYHLKNQIPIIDNGNNNNNNNNNTNDVSCRITRSSASSEYTIQMGIYQRW